MLRPRTVTAPSKKIWKAKATRFASSSSRNWPRCRTTSNLVVVAGPIKPIGQHEIDALERLPEARRAHDRDVPAAAARQSDRRRRDGEAGGATGASRSATISSSTRWCGCSKAPRWGSVRSCRTTATIRSPRISSSARCSRWPRSLTAEPNLKPGLTVTPIAMTSDTSWAEVDLDTLFRQQKAELDCARTRAGRSRW